jgi:hypothetical protein
MRNFLIVLVAAISLAACGTPSPTLPSSSVAAVAASEGVLAFAGRVVLACYAVPACAAVAPKPAIKADYDAAYAAVTAAQVIADAGGSPDLTATTAALSALQALVLQLPPVSK